MQTGSCSLWIENHVLDRMALLAGGAGNFFVFPKDPVTTQKLARLCKCCVWLFYVGTEENNQNKAKDIILSLVV